MTWYLTPFDGSEPERRFSLGTASTRHELVEFGETMRARVRSGDRKAGHLHYIQLDLPKFLEAVALGAVLTDWATTAQRHRKAHTDWVAAGSPNQAIPVEPVSLRISHLSTVSEPLTPNHGTGTKQQINQLTLI